MMKDLRGGELELGEAAVGAGRDTCGNDNGQLQEAALAADDEVVMVGVTINNIQ